MKPPTISQLIDKVGLPKGYKRIFWSDVVDGQVVWLWAQHDGKPRANGPFVVHNVTERRLVARNRITDLGPRTFLQYNEDLLTKTPGIPDIIIRIEDGNVVDVSCPDGLSVVVHDFSFDSAAHTQSLEIDKEYHGYTHMPRQVQTRPITNVLTQHQQKMIMFLTERFGKPIAYEPAPLGPNAIQVWCSVPKKLTGLLPAEMMDKLVADLVTVAGPKGYLIVDSNSYPDYMGFVFPAEVPNG